MNGTAVDDWIGIILDLNACYPVAVDIVLLKQTLKEGKVGGERRREEVEGGGRREKRRRGEEEGGGREGGRGRHVNYLLKQKPRDAHQHT